MAHRAVHARFRVVRCMPDRINAVVTGSAIPRNGAVVDIRRQECIRCVTEGALAFS